MSDEYAKEWLSVEEWQKLRTAPDDKDYQRGNTEMKRWRDALLLKVTYRGGLRISEALDLQYPYNFRTEGDEGFVVLKETKTSDDIELQPVGKDLVREVSRFMQAYYDESETNFVFNNGRGGSLSRQRAYQIVNELAEVVGIDKKLGTHTLRRSRAKHLHESGEMDLSDVSDFLRHSKVSTTRDYLNISKKQMAQTVSKIDEQQDL
ncbi:integrase/recombinase XerD [Haloarcula vallismortis]|uniref:Integrase family protein n=2 Tax=Haloarcula vallismortis TaxID=28442 RepID=M0JNL7_HALVA|nr:tyrosine-type recombinase/integrase [Haloarcula vallismortis]EMA09953.1 integrase family protein [Haloarcula vallismortis ATCC 29715]SDX27859.1 integrase/recombinase XerD [Haloarcula vallismortis]